MKKNLFLLVMMMLPVVASAHDIEVKNADDVTIYYNYVNNGAELEVTFLGTSYDIYSDEYSGNVVIPEEVTYMNETRRVTSIGRYAFDSCSGLTSVTIPNSVTSMGNYAFYGCSGLTSVTIPNSVTSIGDYAFEGCNYLKKVIVSDIAAWCGISFGNYHSNPLYYAHHLYSDENTKITDLIIPNSVTSIGGNAFVYCSGLTSVTIPNSVTSIGASAFDGCSGLTSVTIPNSVTSMGNGAFNGCSGLTSVTIPNSVTSIGENVFSNCSRLTSITIDSNNTVFDSRENCNAIIETATNTLITGCQSTLIPNSVTSIGDYAFYGCSGLTSVTIPNSVTTIGGYAFFGCSGLTSVTIPNSVTTIGGYAFYDCSSLKKVIVSDIAAWCGISFGNYHSNPLYYAHHLYSDENTKITDLIIPNSVTSIGDYAFFGCSGLTSVTIPNSVTSIGSWAFQGCSGLTSVTIGNSVTSIGQAAFNGCSGLTSVTIPNSVTTIGGHAFYRCRGLASVTIGNSVTSIGGYAFNGCSGLTSVTIGSGVTSIGNRAFDGVDIPTIISLIENPFAITGKTSNFRTFSQNTFNNATLYVPKGTIDKYKATEGWQDFVFIEEGIITDVADIPANAVLIQSEEGAINVHGCNDGEQVSVYSINGTKAGSAVSENGSASINTALQPGNVAIVKIGEKSVKIIMK